MSEAVINRLQKEARTVLKPQIPDSDSQESPAKAPTIPDVPSQEQTPPPVSAALPTPPLPPPEPIIQSVPEPVQQPEVPPVQNPVSKSTNTGKYKGLVSSTLIIESIAIFQI